VGIAVEMEETSIYDGTKYKNLLGWCKQSIASNKSFIFFIQNCYNKAIATPEK
jgi:hypothetical protein